MKFEFAFQQKNEKLWINTSWISMRSTDWLDFTMLHYTIKIVEKTRFFFPICAVYSFTWTANTFCKDLTDSLLTLICQLITNKEFRFSSKLFYLYFLLMYFIFLFGLHLYFIINNIIILVVYWVCHSVVSEFHFPFQ